MYLPRRHLSQKHTTTICLLYEKRRLIEKTFWASRGGRPHRFPFESSTIVYIVRCNLTHSDVVTTLHGGNVVYLQHKSGNNCIDRVTSPSPHVYCPPPPWVRCKSRNSWGRFTNSDWVKMQKLANMQQQKNARRTFLLKSIKLTPVYPRKGFVGDSDNDNARWHKYVRITRSRIDS